MRQNLWPMVYIALAVAVGIAIAPYIGWIAVIAVVLVVAFFALGVLNLAYRWLVGRIRAGWQWLLDQGVDPPDV